MKGHGLILKNKYERGFTVLELIIAFGVIAIVIGGIMTGVFQVFNLSARSSNHMVAVRQVQEAGYWVSHDVQMAQTIPAAAGIPFTVGWTELVGTPPVAGPAHSVTYSIVGTNLQRSETITTGGVPSTKMGIVAQHIDGAQSSLTLNLPELVLTVTARVGSGSQQETESRVYRVMPRPFGQ